MDHRRGSLQLPRLRQTNETSVANRIRTTSDSSNKSDGSSLLQELLRERRASINQSKKHGMDSRTVSGPKNASKDGETHSSPIISMATRAGDINQGRRPSAPFGTRPRALSAPKEMGIRETDAYVSKITKQNFDLKLELVYRRRREDVAEAKLQALDTLAAENRKLRHASSAMEAKLQKLRTLEAENKELKSVNKGLVRTLEKREQGMQAAVRMICDLEEKVEMLQVATINTKPSTATPDTQSSTTETSITDSLSITPRSSPPQRTESPPTPKLAQDLHRRKPHLRVTHTAPKTPSVPRDKKESASALRSLYLADEDAGYSTMSFISPTMPGNLFANDDAGSAADPDDYPPKSPSLSLLSESSFISVYGPPKHADGAAPPRQTEAHRQPDEDIVRERDAPPAPIITPGPVEGVPVCSDLQREMAAYVFGGQKEEEEVGEEEEGKGSTSPTLAGPIFGNGFLPPASSADNTRRPSLVRKWGARIGRSASLKIKQGWGRRKGEKGEKGE